MQDFFLGGAVQFASAKVLLCFCLCLCLCLCLYVFVFVFVFERVGIRVRVVANQGWREGWGEVEAEAEG